jgi:glutamate formiminotransferase/formiminotetrahydrofolate cyclodeaminase
MEVSLAAMDVASAMVDDGLPASISDAGVAALCGRSAVMGAYLNVRVNSGDLADETTRRDFLERGLVLQRRAVELERSILERVDTVMG